jgi:hypothetical protein
VLSVEPSSQTITSSGGCVCASTDWTASWMHSAALCAAMTTEKLGGASRATASLVGGARNMRADISFHTTSGIARQRK